MYFPTVSTKRQKKERKKKKKKSNDSLKKLFFCTFIDILMIRNDFVALNVDARKEKKVREISNDEYSSYIYAH